MRAQLKFLEELDRVERKRHEEQERDILLKAAKSRSKTEDPEQAKLKAKAKEVGIHNNLQCPKNLQTRFLLTQTSTKLEL